MTTILVIEDDLSLADFLKRALSYSGFDVEVASSGAEGLKAAKSSSPDLVVLDLILPDMDGIDICRDLRLSGDTGIIILTARHLVGDRVLGLHAGADDYLPKPFALEELVARIHSVLRRKKILTEIVIHVGDLDIDIARRQVRRGSRLVELTTREFELLRLLAENTGRPVRKEVILEQVWGDEYEADSNLVKTYVNTVRRKLNSGGEADLIQVVRCFGYVLMEAP